MKRPRCNKGILPRAKREEMDTAACNCIIACERYRLSTEAAAMAMYSLMLDRGNAARCYAAIVRSLP